MPDLMVDVIVAVHNDRRPVERAVASALLTSLEVRATIVAHNVDAARIRERLGDLGQDSRVRILELSDGVRSPANAFNRGLDASTARYVAIIGSDDSLEPGALDAWVHLAESTHADAVIAPIVRDGGHGVPTPRIRRSRAPRLLDADRDRLYERTAPLGLQRRSATGALRYEQGLARGVDQVYGLRLWANHRVVFDPDGPAYREHADQDDRVTHAFGPIADDFAFLATYLDEIRLLPAALRRAAVAKTIRVHVVPAVRNRISVGTLSHADLAAAAEILSALEKSAPRARGLLPRTVGADLRAIEAMSSERLSSGRGIAQRMAELLPMDLRLVLHRHGPLRNALAGRALARRVTRGFAMREATRAGAVTSPDGGVVVLSPEATSAARDLSDECGGIVIGWRGTAAHITVERPSRWSIRAQRLLGGGFPTRILLRVLGADDATQFARRLRGTPAEAALRRATLIVAAEEDGVLAAWRAQRASGGSVRAVHGLAAAREMLQRQGRPS